MLRKTPQFIHVVHMMKLMKGMKAKTWFGKEKRKKKKRKQKHGLNFEHLKINRL